MQASLSTALIPSDWLCDPNLGRRIALARRMKRWSQRDLARACGVSQPRISRLERDPGGATIDLIRIVADRLGVTVPQLAGKQTIVIPAGACGGLRARDLLIADNTIELALV